MQTSSLTVAAALGVAGLSLGATHVYLTDKRDKRAIRMQLTEMHADLSRDTAANHPDIVAAGTFTDVDPAVIARGITCNRWLALWSAMLRHGFINEKRAAKVARNFMENRDNALWWRRAEDYRSQDFQDEHDQHFHQVMKRAHAASQATA
ncbi:DUF6082 family protein [Streptomyces sp. NBC_01335]|uniref:DUF6082 family protein n=1 Tax=Streptomyces sp. NBC_01335 TaxID=2903828 RepID=UPI002E12DA2B|nr:DUF6082 family protein [Streptomyces sp. NBC_01335]